MRSFLSRAFRSLAFAARTWSGLGAEPPPAPSPTTSNGSAVLGVGEGAHSTVAQPYGPTQGIRWPTPEEEAERRRKRRASPVAIAAALRVMLGEY